MINEKTSLLGEEDNASGVLPAAFDAVSAAAAAAAEAATMEALATAAADASEAPNQTRWGSSCSLADDQWKVNAAAHASPCCLVLLFVWMSPWWWRWRLGDGSGGGGGGARESVIKFGASCGGDGGGAVEPAAAPQSLGCIGGGRIDTATQATVFVLSVWVCSSHSLPQCEPPPRPLLHPMDLVGSDLYHSICCTLAIARLWRWWWLCRLASCVAV